MKSIGPLAPLVIVGMVLVGCGSGDDDTTQAPATTEARATTQASPATTEAPATTEPTCAYLGVDDFGDMQLELGFSNPLGDTESLEVTYSLLDGAGVRFSTGSEYFELVSAGEQFRAAVDTVESVPPNVDEAGISCQILDIGEGFSFGDSQAPSDQDTCEFVEVDPYGDIQILVSITSPFDTTEDISITYGLYGPGQTRFEDSTTTIEVVGSGETVRSSVDTITDVPDWLDADQVTCAVLGVQSLDF